MERRRRRGNEALPQSAKVVIGVLVVVEAEEENFITSGNWRGKCKDKGC